MLFKGFNTRKAAEAGIALADQVIPLTKSDSASRTKPRHNGKELQTFLAQVDRETRALQLGFFSRAKLANSFKWRLLDSGIEQTLADELTGVLLVRLSERQSDPTPADGRVATPANSTDSNKVEVIFSQATACTDRSAHAEAIDRYLRVLELKPRHLLARNNLGVALLKLGRYREAEEQFRQAIGIKSSYPDAHFNLGTVLRWRGDIAESEMPLRRALKLNPTYVEARVSLGMTLVLLARLRDAVDCFEKALRVAPRHAGALFGLGQVAAIEGRFDEAEASFKRALEIDPKMPAAWAALAGLRRMTKTDAAWVKGAEEIAASGLAPLEEADVRFAIGKYYDDTADFGRAFKSYERANELQKTFAGRYDRDERTRFVDDLIRVYTREALSDDRAASSDSTKPVFVVGMMRSGTSLVEQIISSHPAVRGAGELSFWNDAVRKHEGVVRKQLLDEPTRKKLAEAYLRTLAGYSTDAHRVVDKATFNSDHLGIIHTVFRNARIIYVQRDPIDTCLSCYFQQFSLALNFTMDLGDLAHYYREHHRLIAHWRAVLPAGTLLDVPYAELVMDQEKWTHRIVEFLGLDWDPRCLDFQETKRPVLTASYWQVRQKIYKNAVGRWRNYEKFIGPLRDLKGL
jgi:tetratricopeptide (TPR) repeat protein